MANAGTVTLNDGTIWDKKAVDEVFERIKFIADENLGTILRPTAPATEWVDSPQVRLQALAQAVLLLKGVIWEIASRVSTDDAEVHMDVLRADIKEWKQDSLFKLVQPTHIVLASHVRDELTKHVILSAVEVEMQPADRTKVQSVKIIDPYPAPGS